MPLLIDLHSFLMSVSKALDYAEEEVVNITVNHSKRCAYIALMLSKELNLHPHEQYDACSYALLHDCGITETFLNQDSFTSGHHKNLSLMENIKDHCTIGEQYIASFPFLGNSNNIIKFHHEYYDGSGFFGLKGDDIPLIAQFISFADTLDMSFDLSDITSESKNDIYDFIKDNNGILFNPTIVQAFFNLSEDPQFWNNLRDDCIVDAINTHIPHTTIEMDSQDLLNISTIFSRIVNSKSRFTAEHSSNLAEKAMQISSCIGFDQEKAHLLTTAANLHDIGKLGVPRKLLEKNGTLDEEEFSIVREHALMTDLILRDIKGFETIRLWAAAHHERLDGSGYPFGLTKNEITFEMHLLAALEMYQALTEERPYRNGLLHDDAITLMYEQVAKGHFEQNMVQMIDKAFMPNSYGSTKDPEELQHTICSEG